MTEPEVSLLLAINYIQKHKTEKDVKVSIDGAHIKTGNQIHFNITGYLKSQGLQKIDNDLTRWQGIYEMEGYPSYIRISSTPGIGDVNIELLDGKILYVESKKGKSANKSGQEYMLMREAIGQLMTGCEMSDSIIPVVAVPSTPKSKELALRWSVLPQIEKVGIHFILVKEDGEIEYF